MNQRFTGAFQFPAPTTKHIQRVIVRAILRTLINKGCDSIRLTVWTDEEIRAEGSQSPLARRLVNERDAWKQRAIDLSNRIVEIQEIADLNAPARR